MPLLTLFTSISLNLVFTLFYVILLRLAPSTGFEPASPFRPTAFKAAPSPPGQTAYRVVGGISTLARY